MEFKKKLSGINYVVNIPRGGNKAADAALKAVLKLDELSAQAIKNRDAAIERWLAGGISNSEAIAAIGSPFAISQMVASIKESFKKDWDVDLSEVTVTRVTNANNTTLNVVEKADQFISLFTQMASFFKEGSVEVSEEVANGFVTEEE